MKFQYADLEEGVIEAIPLIWMEQIFELYRVLHLSRHFHRYFCHNKNSFGYQRLSITQSAGVKMDSEATLKEAKASWIADPVQFV